MEGKPVYYDTERNQMYWIEWFDTGNLEIPTRHYIGENHATKTCGEKAEHSHPPCKCEKSDCICGDEVCNKCGGYVKKKKDNPFSGLCKHGTAAGQKCEKCKEEKRLLP